MLDFTNPRARGARAWKTYSTCLLLNPVSGQNMKQDEPFVLGFFLANSRAGHPLDLEHLAEVLDILCRRL